MITGNKYTGREADIWSIGVILYALLCGYLPFDDDSNPRLYNLILSAKYEFPSFLSAGSFACCCRWWTSLFADVPFLLLLFSTGSRDLISKLLRVTPAERLTLAQIKQHPWLCELPVPPPQKQKAVATS